MVDVFIVGIGKSKEYEKYIVYDLMDIREFIDVFRMVVKDIGVKRLVVDLVMMFYINKLVMVRSIVMQFKCVLVGFGVMSIFVSQISVGECGFGGFGVEYGVDGIICFDFDEIDGELKCFLIVWKMCGMSYSMRRYLFDIIDKGIIVYFDKVFKRKVVIEFE